MANIVIKGVSYTVEHATQLGLLKPKKEAKKDVKKEEKTVTEKIDKQSNRFDDKK